MPPLLFLHTWKCELYKAFILMPAASSLYCPLLFKILGSVFTH